MKEKLEEIIALHDSMRNCYFWNGVGNSRSRRWYEEKHSLTTNFDFEGDSYKVEQITTCSCRNVYYKMYIYKNDERFNKDIRFIKKVLKTCA
jgi:hypothetical protein